MDEEFKLCWKNFQDNIASGFQNLYDRGDLVDVTLACDGKLLHAHKIVLAICSPYFQQIFITNPCKHPIIILKDVTFNIMCELLEFMYQGVVNVKHAELQSFMKIGQLLQIKGLATNSSSSAASTSSEKSTSQTNNPDEQSRNNNENNAPNAETPAEEKSDNANEANPNPSLSTPKQNASNANRPRSPSTASPSTPSYPGGLGHHQANIKSENSPAINYITGYHVANAALKRQADFSGSETSSPLFSRKQLRRSLASAATDQNSDISDANESATGMDSMSNEDFLLPSISMVESRYDLQSLKREHSNSERDYREGGTASAAAVAAAASLRNTFGAPFGFDYNIYKNNNSNTNSGSGNNSAGSSQQTEYPNELHMPNDYSKNFGNHMEIPPSGSNLVMLTSTSLLHGNCVFNRNNTVATQQGMKTYWLCKSYRVSMCRARCITHQGRIISATGVHNHPPHMRGGAGNAAGANNNGPPSNTSISGNTSGGYTESNVPASSSSQASTSACPDDANATAIASNSGLCNTTIHSITRLSHNSVAPNVFTHNMHAHSSQQSVQQPPPPPPPPPTHHTPLFTHSHHLLPSASHHQPPLTIAPLSSSGGNNSVIQNVFNASNLMHMPNMLPPPSSHHEQHQQHQHHHHHHHQQQQQHQQQQHQQQQQQQQEQHSPHLTQHPQHLEITSLMHSSTTSNTSHQHGRTLSNSPTIKGESTNNNAMHSLQRSPSHLHMNNEPNLNDSHIAVINAALSPNSEINPSTNNGSLVEVSSLSSQNESEHEAAHHQAQVIDSITISPPNANDGQQHFKMEKI